MINKDIAVKFEDFYSNTESAVGLIIKPTKRHKLKVAQPYSPTSSHDAQLLESFYEDVELAMSKVKTHYTVLVVDGRLQGHGRQEAIWKPGGGRILHRFQESKR